MPLGVTPSKNTKSTNKQKPLEVWTEHTEEHKKENLMEARLGSIEMCDQTG